MAKNLENDPNLVNIDHTLVNINQNICYHLFQIFLE